MGKLNELLEQLKAQEFSSERHRRLAECLRQDSSLPSPGVWSSRTPSSLLRDYVRRQLTTAYSDYQFWQRVDESASTKVLCEFLESRYGLRLPPIPCEVWRETASQPGLREKLFDQLAARYADLIPGSDPEARTELIAKGLIDIIDLYLSHPHASKARILKELDLSADALKTLERAGKNLAEDARQCLRGKTETKLTVRGRRGAPVDLERRQDVEGMVKLLREHPDATNHQIAKLYYPRETIIERCGETQIANEAKLLARFREGLPVKFYTDDNGVGRRPSRKTPKTQ